MIGIAGGSGSGKSTFAQRIKEAFPSHVSLISCDNYYLPHDELPLEKRAKLNYDAPEALEFDLMVNHLEQLKNGEVVYYEDILETVSVTDVLANAEKAADSDTETVLYENERWFMYF
ncbi:MAG: hypothetical protein IKJ50_07160 [Clostridia bacterium]|nr:hypothetical protein [Clostridia bacterium]